MPDTKSYTVIYSDRSLVNIGTIKSYLLYNFTQREVDNLYRMISSFENVAATFPELYPLIANSKKIRRAVLSKQLSIFYTCSKKKLFITAILDNRMDNSKRPK